MLFNREYENKFIFHCIIFIILCLFTDLKINISVNCRLFFAGGNDALPPSTEIAVCREKYSVPFREFSPVSRYRRPQTIQKPPRGGGF